MRIDAPVRRAISLVAILALATGAAASADLIWHVETADGTVVESRLPDEPFNPASVVKVATSWWALEQLGRAHRFETRFLTRGTIDAKTGTLEGDLLVAGGYDPDLHGENAFLVAEALRTLGIRAVRGNLIVDRAFRSGWEGGAPDPPGDPATRSRRMALRLRRDLDPDRWTAATRRIWSRFADRQGSPGAPPRGVRISGSAGEAETVEGTLLVVHRSRELPQTLRRFDAWSNNDIARFGDVLGTPADLSARLADALGAPSGEIRLSSLSGLGENRMTSRLVVRLLHRFRHDLESMGLAPEDVLPTSGCVRGTLGRLYPSFARGEGAGALVAKTGTLVQTDGGVSALAGYLRTRRGDLVFSVAVPRSGRATDWARREIRIWLESLAARHGGPMGEECPGPLPESETGATAFAAGAPPPL